MAREASKCAKTKADEVNAILSAMNWQGDEWVVNKDDVPVDEASFRYSDYVSYATDKNPGYPIRAWTLSEHQLRCFRTRYYIAEELKPSEVTKKIY